jgi:hypothetical protein
MIVCNVYFIGHRQIGIVPSDLAAAAAAAVVIAFHEEATRKQKGNKQTIN